MLTALSIECPQQPATGPILSAPYSSVQCPQQPAIGPILPAPYSSVQCPQQSATGPILPAPYSSVQCPQQPAIGPILPAPYSSVHTLSSHLYTVDNFKTSHPSMPKVFLPSDFGTAFPYQTSHAFYLLHSSHPLLFDDSSNFLEISQIVKLLSMKFSPATSSLSALLLCTLFCSQRKGPRLSPKHNKQNKF
jgi:hypothetical protein